MFSEDYPGGAELTTDAIIKGVRFPVLKIRSGQLSLSILKKFNNSYWVFGNFSQLDPSLMIYISQNVNYTVLEYDYKFCKYRSTEKHVKAEGQCDCKLSKIGKIVSIFLASAKNVWFMSEGQRKFYCDLYPFLNKESTKVLSSVFDEESLEYFSQFKTKNKNDKWLIQKSNSWIKGTEDAIEYAKENNLNYELFENLSYDQMLKKFSESKGFLTFPRGKDTCPRTAIEAKLLGCEIISNENVQHREEEWFTGSQEDTLSYLKKRTQIFWNETINNSNLNFPKISDNVHKDKTHFKIIVPVYNSKEWIDNCIKSIINQDYENYECVICDDISNDGTYERAIESLGESKKVRVLKNKEKKFALKNIYDAVKATNPSGDDVIVVLDGDDWFSTDHVLSNLSKYYQESKCWMTYGSFMEFPSGRIGIESTDYPDNVIENNSYRKDRWRASHLKTFKYFLWERVKKEDLLDDDGEFYEMTYDQAMMLPMLEMSGPKAKYIKEINYIYNTSNPNAVNKTRAKKQHDLMLKIRSKSKYKRLKNEDIA